MKKTEPVGHSMDETTKVAIRSERAMAFMHEVGRLTEAWPQERKNALSARWRTLQANGCEMCDMLFEDDILHVAISDDLRRLFADFGIRLK